MHTLPWLYLDVTVPGMHIRSHIATDTVSQVYEDKLISNMWHCSLCLYYHLKSTTSRVSSK